VLSNDNDVDSAALTAKLVDGPQHGTLTLAQDGSFSYQPDLNYNGADTFAYRANDGQADSNVATVALTIRPVNDAPVFVSTPPTELTIDLRVDVSGDAVLYAHETVTLEFRLDQAKAAFKNEVGIYAVEDAAGRVNGLLPGDPGYAKAALDPANRQILFQRADKPCGKVPVRLTGGRHYGFYLVQNASSTDLLERNPGNTAGGKPLAFFSLSAANPDRFDHLHASIAEGRLTMKWEDLAGGGDRDFGDAVLSAKLDGRCGIAFVQPAGDMLPVAAFASGGTADRVFQVPTGTDGDLQAAFTWGPRQAAYKSEFGIYRIDDATGRIGNLKPGDPGYAAKAIERSQVAFAGGAEAGERARLALQPGGYYGFYLIANGSSGELLARNPGNSLKGRPLIYFSFEQANPDRFDHLHGKAVGGRLQLDWEDTVRGGDRDFDDARILVQLEQLPAPTVLRYQAQATDVDGDPLSYRLLAGPDGATIDPLSGLLTWNARPGQYQFVIRVEDGHGGSADQSFILLVRERSVQVPAIDWSKRCRLPEREECGERGRWHDDFVNRLGRCDDERNPNSKLRVCIAAAADKASAVRTPWR
jgi:VCBS repeat-containing protein